MFYFMTNDPDIIVKCRWRSGDAVSGTLRGVQGVKVLKNFDLFTSGGQINSLK